MKKSVDLNIIWPSKADDDDDTFVYPRSPIVITLRSKVLPSKLLEKLLKQAEAHVAKLVADKKPQALSTFEFIRNILESNNLIPAWSEVPQIR